MRIPWQGNKCILCCNEASLTLEHLIPKALGGILTSDLLCKACNSSLGASFEAAARSDPSIRIAVRNLQAKIPTLAEKLSEKQAYLGIGPGGTERGVIRNGDFRIKSKTAEDGSLIQPSDDARKSIKKILLKAGSGIATIEGALRLLKKAPENERVQVAPGLEVVKWSIEEHECFRVDRLNSSEYKPFHGICFEGNHPHARVQIRLFGWLAFRVHFLRLAVGGPRFVYTHYLDSNSEDIRVLEPVANEP